MSSRAIVVAPNPTWAATGKALASRLSERLGPLALRVEHIGSTAIPAMPAKDLLDLQVSAADLEQAAGAFTEPLAALSGWRCCFAASCAPTTTR